MKNIVARCPFCPDHKEHFVKIEWSGEGVPWIACKKHKQISDNDGDPSLRKIANKHKPIDPYPQKARSGKNIFVGKNYGKGN